MTISTAISLGAHLKLPTTICGREPLVIRDLFKTFVDLPIQSVFKGGVPKIIPKRMTADFIASTLQIPQEEALKLATDLVNEGWLEHDKPIPTTRGVALAQYVDRPRISRPERNSAAHSLERHGFHS